MAPQMQSSLRTHRERRRSWRTPSSPPAGFTLALGGGAARGWSHVGVLRALEEGGLRPRRIVGTSMGALVGLFAAADKLEALHAAGLALDRRALLSFLDVAIPRAGLIDGKRLRALLREHVTATDFDDLQVPFCAVAACLETGEEVLLDRGDPIEAVRASISVPGLFRPVCHEGGTLVDGGLVNPVPVNVARDSGAGIVVAVDVNHYVVEERPYLTTLEAPTAKQAPVEQGDVVDESVADGGGFRLPAPLRRLAPSLSWPSWAQGFGGGRVSRIAEAHSPSIVEVLLSSIAVSEVTLSRLRLKAYPPDVLIRPRVGHIRFLDFHRAAEAFDAGHQAGVEALPFITSLLPSVHGRGG